MDNPPRLLQTAGFFPAVGVQIPAQLGYPLYALVKNKYYVDEFFGAVFIRPTLALAAMVGAFDRHVVDAIVDGIAWLGDWFARLAAVADRLGVDALVGSTAAVTLAAGRRLRRLSTGGVQSYMLTLVAVVVFAVFFFSVISR